MTLASAGPALGAIYYTTDGTDPVVGWRGDVCLQRADFRLHHDPDSRPRPRHERGEQRGHDLQLHADRWHRAARGRSRVRDGIRNDPERQPDDPDARRDDLVHREWDGSADVPLADAVHSAAFARLDDDGDGLRDGRWDRQPDRRVHLHEDRSGLP